MAATNDGGLIGGGLGSCEGGSNEARPWLGHRGAGKARLGRVRGLIVDLVAHGFVDWCAQLTAGERRANVRLREAKLG